MLQDYPSLLPEAHQQYHHTPGCILQELPQVWSQNPNINWGILHPPLEADARQATVQPEANTHAQNSGETVTKPLVPWPRWLIISRPHRAKFDSTLPLPHSVTVKNRVVSTVPGHFYLLIQLYLCWHSISFSSCCYLGVNRWEKYKHVEIKYSLFSHCHIQLWLPHTTIGHYKLCYKLHYNLLFY